MPENVELESESSENDTPSMNEEDEEPEHKK